jgi:thioredoxin-related protein
LLPVKKFGLSKATPLWYDLTVRNIFVFVFSISIMFLAGCGDNVGATVDMSSTVTDTNAPPLDLSSEIAQANTQKKLLLLEFGSSDACPPCVALQQHVFSTSVFQDYEKSNLLFLRLDYPLKHPLRFDTQATNDILAQQFNVGGYPTFIALDDNGKEFWRIPENDDSGIDVPLFNPTNFISLLESVRKKEK